MNPTADSTQLLGSTAEELACHYLVEQGLQLTTRNFRGPRGEIDLIMRDGNSVVFVEVRYRRSSKFGSGAETVDSRKQSRLIATAMHYLQAHRNEAKQPARFDVVAVSPGSGRESIQWIRDAFQA